MSRLTEGSDPRGDNPPLEIAISGEGIENTMILDSGEFLIGRALEAEVHLPDAAVSRRHARLFNEGESWFIEDLGSRHGTEIGGARIAANRRAG